jgi:hypothetical protein
MVKVGLFLLHHAASHVDVKLVCFSTSSTCSCHNIRLAVDSTKSYLNNINTDNGRRADSLHFPRNLCRAPVFIRLITSVGVYNRRPSLVGLTTPLYHPAVATLAGLEVAAVHFLGRGLSPTDSVQPPDQYLPQASRTRPESANNPPSIPCPQPRQRFLSRLNLPFSNPKMGRFLTTVLSCIHNLLIQLPQNGYHNISRVVQPQIRNISDSFVASSSMRTTAPGMNKSDIELQSIRPKSAGSSGVKTPRETQVTPNR